MDRLAYTGQVLLWLFFLYSFIGWVLETAGAALRQRRFVNRGLVNGPLCVVYGVTAVGLTVAGDELPLFWLFVGSAILATVVEWIAGHILERIYRVKWWDYSSVRWNLDGYVCVPASLLWGVFGVIAVRWANPLFSRLIGLLPQRLSFWLLLFLTVLLALDMLATLLVVSGRARWPERWKSVDFWFSTLSYRLGRRVTGWVDRRIARAYPRREEEAAAEAAKEERAGAFAGCSFYKIVLLFVIGCVLGDITETIFCRIRAGVWMSRSSLVWGPFSIVWGFAIAAVTVLLYRYRERSDRFLFLTGTVLGGAYEYLCSVLSEIVFGTVFWDYSSIPFNLGGRINLLYCFFWGLAAVVWFKGLYPRLSALIERLPERSGKWAVRFLLLFMCCNMAVSAMALIRSDQRSRGVPAQASWQEIMDERFDDARLERIYPNAIRVEQEERAQEEKTQERAQEEKTQEENALQTGRGPEKEAAPARRRAAEGRYAGRPEEIKKEG